MGQPKSASYSPPDERQSRESPHPSASARCLGLAIGLVLALMEGFLRWTDVTPDRRRPRCGSLV